MKLRFDNSSSRKELSMAKTKLARIKECKVSFLDRVDGRSVEARRYREVYRHLVFAIDGDAELNEAQRQLIRRASTLIVESERMEATLAKGDQIDFETYCKLTNTLSRLFRSLGIETSGVASTSPVMALDEYVARQQPETGDLGEGDEAA